jgi:hypothetical protein
MCARQAISLLAVLLLLSETDLPAQETQATDTAYAARRVVVPGSRVRIDAPTLFAERLDGTVEALRPDTLLLRLDPKNAETTLIPVASVERLQVFQGNQAAYGEIFGTIAGMLAGGLLAHELVPSDRYTGVARSVSAGAGVLLGGLAGYLIGKQVDKAVFGERWKEVPISRVLWETRLQPRVAAYPDGKFVFALSFYH